MAITFNAATATSTYGDLFTDSATGTEWYQLWVGNADGTTGDYVVTEYGKGWIEAADLDDFMADYAQAGASDTDLWVSTWTEAGGSGSWEHGAINFADIDTVADSRTTEVSGATALADMFDDSAQVADYYNIWIDGVGGGHWLDSGSVYGQGWVSRADLATTFYTPEAEGTESFWVQAWTADTAGGVYYDWESWNVTYDDPNDIITLTNSIDIVSGNVFNAPRVWNPDQSDLMNSLNDDDELTGTGDNPTLNLTFVNDTETADMSIMPQMTNIETVNVDFTADVSQVLDLQDTTGLKNVAANRIDNTANVMFDNIQSVLTTARVANSNDNTLSSVIFDHRASILAGDTDEVALTISDVQMNNLRIDGVTQGYETINLSSLGAANSLDFVTAEELKTLNIDGDQDLRLGGSVNVMNGGLVEAVRHNAAFVNVAGSFDTLDASIYTGVLDVTMGGELNAGADGTSGQSVDFALTGGEGNDIIRIAAGTNLDLADAIDGGAGATETNTLVTYGSSAFAGAVANVQALEIRSGHDGGVLADAVVINAARFTELESTLIRNEGQAVVGTAWVSAGEALATTLNNMTDDQAAALTYLHGTTGNSSIVNNLLTVDFATNAASNTVGLTLADAANTDLRFNMQVTSPEANSMAFTDSDTESNTVGLNSFATVNTAINIAGGTAGTYFNLDRLANGFGFDQTGGTTDARVGVAGAFTGAPVGTNISAVDTAVNATYGYATTVGTSGQYTVFNSRAGGELLTTSTIDASGTVSDVIVRVGTGNQTISTNTGDDVVIFADTAGISSATAGLTIADTVAMSTGTDTLILDGRAAAVNVGASEWTNLSGVDVLRLSGAPGATAFQVQITDQFVDQTDDGSNLTIINNDGDLRNANENVATVDLTSMSADNGVTFIGADGDGSAAQAGTAVQTIILDDVTANGKSTLDGGDRNIITNYSVTEFGTQAAADAAYLANVAANVDGNDNFYQVNSGGTNAEVTVGDLANVSNFSTIQWQNDASVARRMNLTLDSATVGNLVDASHAANSTAVETLRVEAVDSTTVAGATADMNLAAGTVSNAYNLQVMAGRGADTITTGAGADTVVMAGGYVVGTYGVDATTGFDIDGRSTATAAVHNVTDTVTMGAGNDTLITYGAINLAGAALAGVNAITANSALVITLSQWNAMVAEALAAGAPTSDLITFSGNSTHQLTIVNDVVGGGAVDLSRINLGNGSLVYDVTSSVQGAGSGAIATNNAIDDNSATGNATPGVVGIAPNNNATNTTVNLAAGGNFTGQAGVDNNFVGNVATLNGTTITGTPADNETLTILDGAAVTLGDGGAGGTITNIDNLSLSNNVNNINFAGATGITTITGGSNNDTVSLNNLGAALTVDLGNGTNSLTMDGSNAYTGTYTAGTGNNDTLVVDAGENLTGATVTGFENLNSFAVAGADVTMTNAQHNMFTGAATVSLFDSITISDAFNDTLLGAFEAYTFGNFANTATLVNGNTGDITGGTGTDDFTATAAQVDAIDTAGNNLVGGAGADSLTLTTALGAATDLNAVLGIESITLAGGAQAFTPSDAIGNVDYSVDASALTGGLTFDAHDEDDSAVSLIGTNFNDIITSDVNGDGTYITNNGDDLFIGNRGNQNVVGGTGVDRFNYNESDTSNADTITGFTSGTDIVGFSIGNIRDNGGNNDTLSTIQGADVNAIAAETVAVVGTNQNVIAANSTNFLFFSSTTSTDFASAIGNGSVTDTAGPNTAGLASTEGIAAVYYDATNSQAVMGYIEDTNAIGTALESQDTFHTIAMVGMSAADYTQANIAASFEFIA